MTSLGLYMLFLSDLSAGDAAATWAVLRDQLQPGLKLGPVIYHKYAQVAAALPADKSLLLFHVSL